MKRVLLLSVMLLVSVFCFGWATFYVDIIGAPNGEATGSLTTSASGEMPVGSDITFQETIAPNTGRYCGLGYDPTSYGAVTATFNVWRNLTTYPFQRINGSASDTFTTPAMYYYVGLIDLTYSPNLDEEENY